ncbi:hypothetical protein CR513_03526, partial [Mucuna pruriens]
MIVKQNRTSLDRFPRMKSLRRLILYMMLYKALSPDDFQVIFFNQLSKTLISLSPEVDCPATFKDFKPISLNNVTYKIITKRSRRQGDSLNPYLFMICVERLDLYLNSEIS